MKNISTTLLPALALLTLAGCAGTSGLATTEPDGVYYSSKDRTTEIVTASAAGSVSGTTDDDGSVANPEYQDNRRSSARGGASDAYYEDDYYYSSRIRRFHQPYYRGLGMGYYDFAYVDPYWYNPAAAFYGYDAFGYPAYFGPRYGGFYDPFWGGYGSGITIGMGFGWGNPWGYSPYRFGYGGYRNGFYDGYYAGAYGNRFYGNGVGWSGYRNGTRSVQYGGPRRERNNEAVSSGGRPNGGGRTRADDLGGRVATGSGNLTNGSNNGSSPAVNPRRPRVVEGNETVGGGGGNTVPNGQNAPGRLDNTTETNEQPPVGPGRGRLYRIIDTEAAPNPGTDGVRNGSQPERLSREEYNTERRGQENQEAVQPSSNEYSRPRRERAYDPGQAPAQQRTERQERRERSAEVAPAPRPSYEPRTNYGGSNSSPGGSNSSGGSRGRGRVE